jgi:SpoVK/Ycf46/Vps4 family AAA+-type ATPase
LMQELELSQIRGFVVATSNLPDTLDLALWRRFDLDIAFPAPTRRELISFANRKARDFALPSESTFRERLAGVRNYADVERVVEDAARRVLLRGA